MESEVVQFFVKIPPTNRSNKRKLFFEYKKYAEEIEVVEKTFLAMLFTDNKFTYEQLFDHYKKEWLEKVESFLKRKTFKYIVVNPDYFYQYYKPIENNERND